MQKQNRDAPSGERGVGGVGGQREKSGFRVRFVFVLIFVASKRIRSQRELKRCLMALATPREVCEPRKFGLRVNPVRQSSRDTGVPPRH